MIELKFEGNKKPVIIKRTLVVFDTCGGRFTEIVTYASLGESSYCKTSL